MWRKARRALIPALVAAAAIVPVAATGATLSSTNPSPADGPWSPPAIDPANFVKRVDNPYFPLKPGTTLRFRGVDKDGVTPQFDTVFVTHRTRQIMGLTCTVVRDTVTSRGRPVQRTYDWFAQDRQGNVWYMGEETQEIRHGQWGQMIDSGPAGKNGAQPGLMMLAHPRAGEHYWQFHWPGHAMDATRVLGLSGTLHLPYGTVGPALITQEQSPLEPGIKDRKWSVRGIGYVQERAVAGSHEEIRLISVTRR